MFRYISQLKASKPSQRLWSLALLSVVLLGAVSERTAIALPRPSAPATAQAGARPQSPPRAVRLPRTVSLRVKRDLVQRFDVSRRDLTVVGFSRETWPDGCLGLAAPNERCMTAMVEGWQVEVTNGQQNWLYRTDMTARVIKLDTQDNSALPPDVTDRLFQTIVQQTGVPASTLRVIESKEAYWDGCMGIYEPDQACTRIAMAGWQVIVAGDQQSWVYHITEMGEQIVQNPTASGSRGDLVPSFIPPSGQPPEPADQNIIFRSTVSGGIAGNISERVLLADGTLYRHVRGLNIQQPSDPIIERRLSSQEVQEFQRFLEEQRFPNLRGLRYITDAAFADYPTTTLEAVGSTVEYIDLEEDNLPEALQAVLQRWEGL